MRKVLIITYYWPPAGGGGVQRWLKFSKYLPRHGWSPVIYTPENADYPLIDESLSAEVSPEVTVIKHPIREPRRIYRKLLQKKSGSGSSESLDQLFYTAPKARSWKQRLGIWIRGNLFIPDARVWWVGPSRRFLTRFIKDNEIGTVVTTGPPHSVHLIGAGLKKRMPELAWIADFRDPWTAIEFYDRMLLSARADRRHHKLEAQVLSSADAVITVSPSWSDMLGAIGNRQVHTITNGFDAEDFDKPAPAADEKLTICHVGTLALDRNPQQLWSALASLSNNDPQLSGRLLIKLMGSTDPHILEKIREAGLDYVDLGYQQHNIAVKEMRSAHCLLLLVNDAVSANVAGRIPGKIFEYLAARKPVIGICPKGGDAAQILAKHDHLVLDPGDPVDPATLRNFLLRKENQAVQDMNIYSRSYLTRALAQILDQTTKRTYLQDE